jgi:hypothetical protein
MREEKTRKQQGATREELMNEISLKFKETESDMT